MKDVDNVDSEEEERIRKGIYEFKMRLNHVRDPNGTLAGRLAKAERQLRVEWKKVFFCTSVALTLALAGVRVLQPLYELVQQKKYDAVYVAAKAALAEEQKRESLLEKQLADANAELLNQQEAAVREREQLYAQLEASRAQETTYTDSLSQLLEACQQFREDTVVALREEQSYKERIGRLERQRDALEETLTAETEKYKKELAPLQEKKTSITQTKRELSEKLASIELMMSIRREN